MCTCCSRHIYICRGHVPSLRIPMQGWLNEDQTHLLLNDELDELYGPNPKTRSLIWNVEQLENPTLKGSFFSSKESTDHNLYIR